MAGLLAGAALADHLRAGSFHLHVLEIHFAGPGSNPLNAAGDPAALIEAEVCELIRDTLPGKIGAHDDDVLCPCGLLQRLASISPIGMQVPGQRLLRKSRRLFSHASESDVLF